MPLLLRSGPAQLNKAARQSMVREGKDRRIRVRLKHLEASVIDEKPKDTQFSVGWNNKTECFRPSDGSPRPMGRRSQCCGRRVSVPRCLELDPIQGGPWFQDQIFFALTSSVPSQSCNLSDPQRNLLRHLFAMICAIIRLSANAVAQQTPREHLLMQNACGIPPSSTTTLVPPFPSLFLLSINSSRTSSATQ